MISYSRIIEQPMLEGTLKDHLVRPLGRNFYEEIQCKTPHL